MTDVLKQQLRSTPAQHQKVVIICLHIRLPIKLFPLIISQEQKLAADGIKAYPNPVNK